LEERDMDNIKVGDIIDGKRVTKVFMLCGELAYQTEPVSKKDPIYPEEDFMNPPEEPEEPVVEEKPKRKRKIKNVVHLA
jgi:hypothetical protein